MDILREMGTDAKKAVDGIWVVLEDSGDHEVAEAEIGDRPAIKIARADNLHYQKALRKRLAPLAARGRRSILDPALQQQAEAQSLYGTVLLDWRNLAAGDQPFPCNEANVLRVWTDMAMISFKERIQGLIQDAELFRMELQEEREKN